MKTKNAFSAVRIFFFISFFLIANPFIGKSQGGWWDYDALANYGIGNGAFLTVPDSIYKLRDSVIVEISYYTDAFDTSGNLNPGDGFHYITTSLGNPSVFQHLGKVFFHGGSCYTAAVCDSDSVPGYRHGYRFVYSEFPYGNDSVTHFDIYLHYDHTYHNCSADESTWYYYLDCDEKGNAILRYTPTRQSIIYVNNSLYNYITSEFFGSEYSGEFCLYDTYSPTESPDARNVTLKILNWIFNVGATEADYINVLNPDSASNADMPANFSINSHQKNCGVCYDQLLGFIKQVDDTLKDGGDPNYIAWYAGVTNSILAPTGFVDYQLQYRNFCLGNYQYAYWNSGPITNGYQFLLYPAEGNLPVIMSQVINDGGSTYYANAYRYSMAGVTCCTAITGITYIGSGRFTYSNGFRLFSDSIYPFSDPKFDTTLYCNALATIGKNSTIGGTPPYFYSWKPNLGIANLFSEQTEVNPPINEQYIRVVSDKYGCKASDTVNITVHRSPKANAGNDTTIYFGLSATIGTSTGATGGAPPYTYSWWSTDGLTSSSPQAVVSPTITTTYALTVTDSLSCTNTDSVIVTVNPIPIDIVARVNKSPYIFEGQVVNSTSYWSHDHRGIYTANTIEISKMLKGSLDCGTVAVVTQGGTVGDINETVSNSLQLTKGCQGIFLCDTNRLQAPDTSYYPASNTQVLCPSFDENSFVRYWWDGSDLEASDLNHNYGSVDAALSLASAYSGYAGSYSWTDCSYTLSHPKRKLYSPQKDTMNRKAFIPTHINPKSNEGFLKAINESASAPSSHPKYRGNTVTYTMSNLTNSQASVSFDIDMSSNTDVFLKSSLIYLEYDTLTYGTNIATNNHITVLPGDLVADDATYPWSQLFTLSNVADNIVAFGISATQAGDTIITITSTYNDTTMVYDNDTTITVTNSLDQSQLTTSPQQLFQVSIEKNDCHSRGEISYTMLSDMQYDSRFVNSPSDNSASTEFDDIVATQKLSFTPCVYLEIKSFSPHIVYGGVGDTLTIRGYHFLNYTGQGGLFFKNANDGGMSEVILDTASDVILWSDTLIKIIVPSYDTIATATISSPPYPVGTGVINIENDSLQTYTSDTALEVLYSVTNRVYRGEKIPFELTADDSILRKFKFHVDTSVWNHPAILGCLQKAVRDWTCLTGVNWSANDSIISKNASFANDTTNVIQFGFTGSTGLGPILSQTYYWNVICDGKAYIYEVDMILSNDSEAFWSYDTTGNLGAHENDMLANLYHELGHAHSLRHVNNPKAIMYYSKGRGPLTSAERFIHLDNDSACYFGGLKVMNLTGTQPFICRSKVTWTMVAVPTCATFEYASTIIPQEGFKVYPNPFDNSITVDFIVNGESKTQFEVINLYGEVISTYLANQLHQGNNTISLDLGKYPEGIYILRAKIDNKEFESKIVHLNN